MFMEMNHQMREHNCNRKKLLRLALRWNNSLNARLTESVKMLYYSIAAA
jgi:hypothetical protein